VNKGIALSIIKAHDLLGVALNDPRTTSVGVFRVRALNTGEDITGNPLHASLILLFFLAVLLGRKRVGSVTLIYTIVVVSTFVLFSWIFKWQSFGGRYHLPFFVLFAPVAGRVLTTFLSPRLSAVSGVVFLLAGWPWLAGIQSRPLIPTPGYSFVNSILVEPRQRLYFSNGLYLIRPYTTMTSMVREANCSKIGFALGGMTAEYPLWVLLGAPRDTLQIEWIVNDASARYTSPDFHPCAVICEGCQNAETFRSLPLVYEFSTFRLYLRLESPTQN
jgi:hypothetical protein